jgi:hypothetical protein
VPRQAVNKEQIVLGANVRYGKRPVDASAAQASMDILVEKVNIAIMRGVDCIYFVGERYTLTQARQMIEERVRVLQGTK